MPSSIPPSASADADAAHSVRHLIGHPLPALIELESTSTKDGTLDLFMVSLSTPAVVFCFDASSTDVDESLRSLDEAVAALRAKEGAGEDGLHVFALCTNGDVEQLKQVKSDLKLSYDILLDTSRAFTSALELPQTAPTPDATVAVAASGAADDAATTSLTPLTLLLREGQITRLDYALATHPRRVGESALRLLRTDQEVEQDWHREQQQASSSTHSSPHM